MTIKHLSSVSAKPSIISTLIKTPILYLMVFCLGFVVMTIIRTNQPEKAVYTVTTNIETMNESKDQITTQQAWVPWWDEAITTTSVANAASTLSGISPVWYRLEPNGELSEIEAGNKAAIKEIALNKQLNIIPTISNDDGDGFNPDSVTTLLSSETKMEAFIEELIRVAKAQGYAGWDIDFEEVKTSDKEQYLQFIKRLSNALHAEDLMITNAVHAREGTEDDREGSLSHDYEVLGNVIDEMRIMAYDFNNKITPPGPVTPLDQLDTVLSYATKTIPVEKIVVGLPLYGYDWSSESVTNVDYLPIIEKIERNNGNIKRDSNSQELIGTYTEKGITHTVYFQDRTSIEAKKKIAEKYGIKKFIYWKLGGEDQTVWQ